MDNYKEAQKTWTASADPALAGGYNQMTPGQKPWYINAPQNYANGGPINPPDRKQMYNDSLTLHRGGEEINRRMQNIQGTEDGVAQARAKIYQDWIRSPDNDGMLLASKRLGDANGSMPKPIEKTEYNVRTSSINQTVGVGRFKKPTLPSVEEAGFSHREALEEDSWADVKVISPVSERSTVTPNGITRSTSGPVAPSWIKADWDVFQPILFGPEAMNTRVSSVPVNKMPVSGPVVPKQQIPARTFQGGFADPAALKYVLGGQNKQLADEELLTPSQLQSRTNYANGGQAPQAHVVPGAQQAGAQVLADAAKTTPMNVPGTGSPTSDGAKLPGAPETQPAVSPGEAVVGEGQFQDMGLAAGAGRDQLQEMLYPLSAMDPMGLYAQGGPASTLSSYIPNYSSGIDPSKNYVETAAQQDKAKTEEPKEKGLGTLIGATLAANLIGGGSALLHNATTDRTPIPAARPATPALPNLNTGALSAKLDSDRARAVATAVHNTRGTQSVGRDLGIVANDQQARTANTMNVEDVENQGSFGRAQIVNHFALHNNRQANEMRAQNAMLEQQHRLMKVMRSPGHWLA